ncbi:MAG: peptidoglycan glycosyltransferase [Alphaproteobacteria bacterium PA4]|nr:MAG: peptidoglycan glycosyltransferase [Alphaproteobacteria bacterium PA4]
MASHPATYGALPPQRVPGERRSAQARARQRLVCLLLLFLCVPVVIGVRLVDLAVFDGPPPPRRLASNAPPRADIVDRNGVLLAHNFEAYAVQVEQANLAGDPRVLAGRIAEILTDRSAADIYAALTQRDKFGYIARRVLPAEAKRINDLGEPGIRLRREAERVYPNFNLAAHLIGYGSDQGVGTVGVEKSFDARLADRTQSNTPVMLSMDVRAQQALEHELRALYIDQSAKGAAGIILDVDTGEIIAMTSLPDFNPNAPGKRPDGERYDKTKDEAALNKVVQGRYELGSTFKALTIASGLNTGILKSLDQTYDATQPMHVAGFTIHDDHPLNRWLNVPDIFIHSSNIGTARIALEVGRENQRAMLEQLGFFERVNIELPERIKPQFPPLSNWGTLATMTISYGHGISVSPLHLANAYATLVNGGIYRDPTVLKRAPGTVPAGRRVFTSATSDTMRKLLRLVVTDGTGRRANAPGYRVGGKTGTAEKNVGRGYSGNSNISTFAAAFPMDAPRYVIIAMVDDPRGSKESAGFKTAGMVVAPAVGRIVTRIAPILGVKPEPGKDLDLSALRPNLTDAPKD